MRDTARYPASLPDKSDHSERVRGSCLPRVAHPAGPAWERRLDVGKVTGLLAAPAEIAVRTF